MELITTFFERIAFSGVNGKVLILPLFFALWVGVGQAKEFMEEIKKVCNEEEDRSASS